MSEPVRMIVPEDTVVRAAWTTIPPPLLSLSFLIGACLCSIFSDMNTVSALPCIGFPFFWLASVLVLGFDDNTNHNHNDNNNDNENNNNIANLPENISSSGRNNKRTNRVLFHVLYFLVPCLCRTIGTIDYFHLGTISTLKAYGISFLILIPILGISYGALWIQYHIMWMVPQQQQQHYPEHESSSSAYAAATAVSSFGVSTRWKTLWGPLTFPILWTAFFQLLFRFSPIGATGNPAMGLPGVISIPLQQGIVSVVGEIGLVFAIGLVSSVGAGSVVISYGKQRRQQRRQQQQQQQQSAESIAQQQYYYNYWILFLVMLYAVLELLGGYRLAQGFGETPISDWPLAQAPSLQVSCICGAGVTGHDDGVADRNLLRRVQTRLDMGDDLIVLSEGALFGRVAPDFFSWPEDNPGAVVALAFLEPVSNTTINTHTNSTATAEEKLYNSIEFLQAGTSLFRYDKNRPVPLLETGVLPGALPPTATEIIFTPQSKTTKQRSTNVTLRVAAAICFDFEFPYLFRQKHADADLVVGPSNYWGSIGENLWSNNIHRAIENGFTLFKCSRNGISGAVDPLGRPLWQQPTVDGDQVTTLLPVRSRVSTVYANYFGYLFGWVCVGVAPLWLLGLWYWTRRNRCTITTTTPTTTTTRTNNNLNTMEQDDVALLENNNENNIVRTALLEEPLLSSINRQDDDMVLVENNENHTARGAVEVTPLLLPSNE